MKNLFFALTISALLFSCSDKTEKREDNAGADATHQNVDTSSSMPTGAPATETDTLKR